MSSGSDEGSTSADLGGQTTSPGGFDPNDPHWRDLGTDSISGQFRSDEADAGIRLEQRVGRLERFNPKTHPSLKEGDWIDAQGLTYDAVGPAPTQHFNLSSFNTQISRHLVKQGVDYVVVDLSGLNATQISGV